MTYTIRDNEGNIVCSVENTTTLTPEVSYESINAELKDLNEYGNKLDKSIEAFNLVSDTRAMEALGYVKGAGFGENIKNVGKEIWKRIKEFFVNIGKSISHLWEIISNGFKNLKNKILKNKKKTEDTLSATMEALNRSNETREAAKALIRICANNDSNEMFLNSLKMVVNEKIGGNTNLPPMTINRPNAPTYNKSSSSDSKAKVVITPEVESKAADIIDKKLNTLINSNESNNYFKYRAIRNETSGSSANVIENATNKFVAAGNKLYGMIKAYHGTTEADDAAFEKKTNPVYDTIFSIKYISDSDVKEISEGEKLKYLKNLLSDLDKNLSNLDNILSRYEKITNELKDLINKFVSIVPDNMSDEDFDALPKAIQKQAPKIGKVASRFTTLSTRIKDESLMYAKLLNFCATI